MQIDRLSAPQPAQSGPTPRQGPDALRTQAKALEAAFLSEMLGYAGVGAARDAFGGGIGEDQFASFLRDQQARLMVDHGGIGLAEQLFQMMQKGDAA